MGRKKAKTIEELKQYQADCLQRLKKECWTDCGTKTAAEILGCTQQQIRLLCKAGKISCLASNGIDYGCRVTCASLETYIHNLTDPLIITFSGIPILRWQFAGCCGLTNARAKDINEALNDIAALIEKVTADTHNKELQRSYTTKLWRADVVKYDISGNCADMQVIRQKKKRI